MILALLLALAPAKLAQIQSVLQAHKLDGWLFFDFRKSDEIAYRVLGLANAGVRSRRWYCLIPARGEPRKLVHAIEPEALDGVPGTTAIYASWRTRDHELAAMLRGLRKVAMQYSPRNDIPTLGRVDAGTVELVRSLGPEVVSSADLVARRVHLSGLTSRFDVVHRGTRLGECTLQIPGRHNVLNALAAIGVGLDLEIPFDAIQKALAGFTGVQRRFQVRGQAGGVTVVDDYGHHPAEVRATLAAAKAGFESRLVTVFQPHRYSRTHHLRQEFLTAFNQADVLVVLDIYAAGEKPIPGVSAEELAGAIRAHGHRDVTYVGGGRARAVEHLINITRPGDLVLTLGAGDVGQIGPDLLLRLEAGLCGGRTTC